MSFTDEDLSAGGDEYIIERSALGLVYIPAHAVDLEEGACIRYEKHPWIEHFELDGIKPAEVCCLWQPGVAAAGDAGAVTDAEITADAADIEIAADTALATVATDV